MPGVMPAAAAGGGAGGGTAATTGGSTCVPSASARLVGGTGWCGAARKSRTCAIDHRCDGSLTMVASSNGVIQPASSGRGGSSLTMR